MISAADKKPSVQEPVGADRRRDLAGEILRFVIVGGVNTATTYALYLLLLHWMRYEFAYAIGYVAGIAIAYALSTTFVFRQAMRVRSAARFPLVYATQFLVSLGLLRIAVEVFHAPHWLALGISIAFTMPITFVMSRRVLRSG